MISGHIVQRDGRWRVLQWARVGPCVAMQVQVRSIGWSVPKSALALRLVNDLKKETEPELRFFSHRLT